MNVTIIFRGGDLAGRHDLYRNDVSPEVLRFHQATAAEIGAAACGYVVRAKGNFGDRLVIHATAVEIVERAEAIEARAAEREGRRKPWLGVGR